MGSWIAQPLISGKLLLINLIVDTAERPQPL